MSETWWTPEAVEALHDAGAYCGTCDYEDWGEDYRCPDCVRCLQGYLTALTPHVEAYTKDARTFTSQFLREMRQAQRAEAFEEAKRIVRDLWHRDLPGRTDDRWNEALDTVLAALDRASTTTPEAT